MIQKLVVSQLPGQPLHIALLGAPGTGKTRLASELRAALAGHDTAAGGLLITDTPAHDPKTCTHILLMGLDLPTHDSLRAAQAAADHHLRQQLNQARVPYSVVYGLGAARLHDALLALHDTSPGTRSNENSNERQRPWVWACDSCSDPDCERRLLSALIAQKKAVTTAP